MENFYQNKNIIQIIVQELLKRHFVSLTNVTELNRTDCHCWSSFYTLGSVFCWFLCDRRVNRSVCLVTASDNPVFVLLFTFSLWIPRWADVWTHSVQRHRRFSLNSSFAFSVKDFLAGRTIPITIFSRQGNPSWALFNLFNKVRKNKTRSFKFFK